MAFSFGFAGDDIDIPGGEHSAPVAKPPAAPITNAFPVPGKPQLPPTHHELSGLLSQLPSKIAYSTLEVKLDDGGTLQLPRRELWDVRVQLMAEEEDDGQVSEGLGNHDVKTGVYEGGFKSWESSVDLVKVLAAGNSISPLSQTSMRVIELGCGTGLPSIALFQWAMAMGNDRRPFSLILADYNPSVLQLVTLPNFILSWALSQQQQNSALHEAFSIEGEVELGPEILNAFQKYLSESKISLSFVSGAWSQEFVDLLYNIPTGDSQSDTILLGAETIYSPFALQAFTETIFSILEREKATQHSEASAFIAAKRLYFGVGGSLDDFIEKSKGKGAIVSELREETDGVRRGVVQCILGTSLE